MTRQYLALDIGEQRIGVATADDTVRIAVPRETIAMNEASFSSDVAKLVDQYGATHIVIGYPRNQSGEPTLQTAYVEARASELEDLKMKVVFQDESLTSVTARERLGEVKRADKGLIDAEAATIFLQDYLEQQS